MRLVKPSFEIEHLMYCGGLDLVERAGRTCYKSESKAAGHESAERFVRMIIGRGHESVLEHSSVTVRFICDSGVSHELVRHRLCAFSQESTRYCNYQGGVTFVIPPWVDIVPGNYANHEYTSREETKTGDKCWYAQMMDAEWRYIQCIESGWTPQQARAVLPNSLKTEIVVTTNLREWRHILKLRTSTAAHPQMHEIMAPLLAELKALVPVVFEDIEAAK